MVSHSGRGMSVGELVAWFQSVSVHGLREKAGGTNQKYPKCQNQRHAGHMDADIDGIVVVGAILLSISKCRGVWVDANSQSAIAFRGRETC